ncbi:metallophosphoesterase [Puniceicoccus vermicola]|uniref:Metallophosphoesterase n=1 Tax=Puniceicoccus vermicola TaxID=388746 RepID=A0A7X1E5W3_9BACT|nr:metallophosphoesterase [Puniceicoccus vermicola]
MIQLNPTPEELESTVVPKSPWFDQLVERMGFEAVRERLSREEILRVRMAPDFLHPDGMADRRLPVRGLDLIIKSSLLANRARRNFEDIRILERKWSIPGLSPEMDGYRLLQASDFHLDFDPGLVSRLEKVLRGLEYDVACLTGDFFDLVFEEESMDVPLLEELIALFPKPKFAVLGNHDIVTVARELEKCGVRVLMNESELIGTPESGFWLAGVDDPRQFRAHSFERALMGREEPGPVVMLAHSPEVYEDAADWDVSLMMSGHTHGGQICLPWGLPISNHFKCPRAMISGAWEHRGVQGYTANGCGGCKLPYRLNAPAEITVHTLRCGR